MENEYFVLVFVLLVWVSPARSGQPTGTDATSTEWRSDEANLVVVRELNRAYARLPFSRECEGVEDRCPVELTWNTGPNLPETGKGGVAGVVGEDIVLVGGLWMPGYQHLAFAYNLKTQTYREIPPPPFKTEYTQGACDGTNVFVIGGRVGGRNVAKLGRTKENGWQWMTLPSLPEFEESGRWLATAQVIPGKWLLLVSGHPAGTPSEERGRPAMTDLRLRLDREGTHWETMAAYPGSVRAMLESAVVRGKLYVFGGSHPEPIMREIFKKLVGEYRLFNAPYAGVPEYRDAYCYDPAKDEWKPIRPLPFPMHGGTGVALQDRYILLMGSSETKSLRVGKTDVSALAGTAPKQKSNLEQNILPYWTGYNDLILC